MGGNQTQDYRLEIGFGIGLGIGLEIGLEIRLGIELGIGSTPHIFTPPPSLFHTRLSDDVKNATKPALPYYFHLDPILPNCRASEARPLRKRF